jgi:hypothetical protein
MDRPVRPADLAQFGGRIGDFVRSLMSDFDRMDEQN